MKRIAVVARDDRGDAAGVVTALLGWLWERGLTAVLDQGTASLVAALGRSPALEVVERDALARHADLIVVLDDGRVAGTGTHAELMLASEPYREIVVSQLGEEAEAA